MDEKTVTVYVRKGGRDHERTFSFGRLDEMPDSEWLDKGIAIDGNEAIFEITTDQDGDYEGPFLNYPDGSLYCTHSMAEAIALVEEHLVEFFKDRGYAVEFA